MQDVCLVIVIVSANALFTFVDNEYFVLGIYVKDSMVSYSNDTLNEIDKELGNEKSFE